MEFLCVLVFMAVLAAAIYGVVYLVNRVSGKTTKRCYKCDSRYEGNKCRTCNAQWPSLPVHSAPGLVELAACAEKAFEKGTLPREAFRSVMSTLFEIALRRSPSPEKTISIERLAKPTASDAIVAAEVVASAKEDVVAERGPIFIADDAVETRQGMSPRERALQNVAARHTTSESLSAAASAPPPTPVPTAPVAPPRPWIESLAAFMEEGNIRWGELVGGLLIVGCSLALVVTFWSEIAERPLLKFLTFNGFTAALFGAGLYTAKKWKLKATSEGILSIATLLVPLNLLAMAAVQRNVEWRYDVIASEVVSIGLLGTLVYLASEFLATNARMVLTWGVMIPSALTLIARRFDVMGHAAYADLVAAAAAAIAGISALYPHWDIGGQAESSSADSDGVDSNRADSNPPAPDQSLGERLRRLALPLFAVAMVGGFLAWRSAGAIAAAHRVSPLVALGAIPLGIVGLQIVSRRRLPSTESRDADAQESWIGLSMATVAGGLLLLAVLLAWPSPVRLLIALGVAAISFAVVAWRRNAPWATACALAVVCGIWSLGFHLATGHITLANNDGMLLTQQLVKNDSGFAWLPLAGVLAASLFAVRRPNGDFHAVVIRLTASAIASWSLLQMTLETFVRRGDLLVLSYGGLAYAGLALLISWQASNKRWFQAFQVLSTIAITIGGVGLIERTEWFERLERPWLDPGTWTVMAAGWASLALVWSLLEWRSRTSEAIDATSWRVPRPFAAWIAETNPPWGGGLLALTLLALVPLSLYTAVPALIWEWSPASALAGDPPVRATRFALPGVDHEHVRTFAAGLALACSAATLLFRGWAAKGTRSDQTAHWRWILGAALAMATVLIGASCFEAHRAAGMVLGWAAGVAVMIAAVGEVLSKRSSGENSNNQPPSMFMAVAIGASAPWLVAATVASVYAALASPWWTQFNGDVLIPTAIVLTPVLVSLAILGGMHAWQRYGTLAPSSLARGCQLLVVVLASGIISWLVIDGLRTEPLAGPIAGSWFASLHPLVGYGIPVACLTVALVGCAIATRNRGAASIAGWLAHFMVGVVFLATTPASAGIPSFATVAHWFGIQITTAAVVAGIWQAIRWFRDRQHKVDESLGGEFLLAPLLATTALLPAWGAIIGEPSLATHIAPYLFTPFAVVSFSALVFAGVVAFRHRLMRTSGLIGIALLAIAVVTACGVEHFSAIPASAFHTLLVIHCAAPVALFAAAYVVDQGWVELPSSWSVSRPPSESTETLARWHWRQSVATIVAMVGAIALVPVIRGWWVGFSGNVWVLGACGVLGVLAFFVGGWSRMRRMHYAALLLLAGLPCLQIVWNVRGFMSDDDVVSTWLVLQVTLGLLAAGLAISSRFAFGAMRLPEIPSRIAGAARPAAWFMLVMWSLTVLLLYVLRSSDNGSLDKWMLAITLTGIVASLGVCSLLWDDEAREALPLAYVLGLTFVGWLVAEVAYYNDDFTYEVLRTFYPLFTMAALGVYSVVVSYLSSRRAELRSFADVAGIPESRGGVEGHFAWLSVVQSIMAAIVSAVALWMSLTFADWETRGIAAKPILGQPIALGLLARGERTSFFQKAAILFATLYGVALSWAALAPLPGGFWVDHVVAAGGVAAIASVICGFGLVKLLPTGNQWLAAAQQLVVPLAGFAACAIAVVFGYEVIVSLMGDPLRVGPLAITIVAATLGGLIVAALAAALLPGRDPFALADRRKQVYVYAAEIAAVLLLVHLRLTMPDVFAGVWRQYWPMICIGIGFLGAALSEYFERAQKTILSEPLRNTGILAPILPAIGYWVAPTGLDYSIVLLTTSLVYIGLAIARKSFPLAILSALCLNGSLWSILHRSEGLRFLDHPQLWLIPGAVCVLIAAHWMRHQLSNQQLTGIRYGAALVLYASSTADVFLNGMGKEVWYPLILAALAIAGVLMGIGMRIRSFLYLGVTFLALAMVAVIKHAAVDMHQTWILWVVGIVTGVAIIALFGLFEKQRETVVRTLDQLKGWEG